MDENTRHLVAAQLTAGILAQGIRQPIDGYKSAGYAVDMFVKVLDQLPPPEKKR